MKVNHLDNVHEAAGRVLLEQLLDRFLQTPPVGKDFLVAILPVYDHTGGVVALDVCSLANGEEFQVGDERFIAAATFIKDQAADRRGAAIVRGFAPVHVLAPTAFNSGRVSEESSPMNKHDHHKEREEHKHKSLAAMAKESSADARARAFVVQQVSFMRARAGQIVAGLKDGSLSIDEAAAVIEGDIAHEEQAGHDIGLAIAHGVPA